MWSRWSRIVAISVAVVCGLGSIASSAQDSGISGKWFTDDAILAIMSSEWKTSATATAAPRRSINVINGNQRDTPLPRPIEPGGPILPGNPIRRFLPATQQQQQQPQQQPQQPVNDLAVMLEIKVDNNKLTGQVTFVATGEKLEAEGGTASGKTFSFRTTLRNSAGETVTTWNGELRDAETLVVKRQLSPGAPAPPELSLRRLK